jgi:hypothetical protein
VAIQTQPELFNADFATPKPANPIFCHEEFLDKLSTHERDSIGKRAAFLLQRLSVDSRRVHYKSTSGINRGWRRSRLGGGSGSHFYAWWAPKNAVPLKDSPGFSNVPDGAVFLRDIRHHDDHSLLNPQAFETQYMPVGVQDLRREEYAPLPYSQPQTRFAQARQPIRLLKGHPGSGKTTALLNAADSANAQRTLYVTYSRDLALLAREYFDRFCSSQKHFDVVTFPDLVRRILGPGAPEREHPREARERFERDIFPFSRTLGAWTNKIDALYDEVHAHLVGDAIPFKAGRFTACDGPRVPDLEYHRRRQRFLGSAPASSVIEVAGRLSKLDSFPLADRYAPELSLAWQALTKVRTAKGKLTQLLEYDCIAIDECQDLTPLEVSLIIELAEAGGRRQLSLLMAGDEAQTVRPTDFEWAWLSDLLHARLGTPAEHKLAANLRSPQRIAEIVNRVWDLYSHIQKQERPSGAGRADIEDDATDQILYCSATTGADLSDLLTTLATREGLALITLADKIPEYVPAAARSAVFTVAEAKGLDFHSVCVLDAGAHMQRIVRDVGRFRADADLEGLRKRLAIDQLRVALSRPTERLIWLDVNPSLEVIRESVSFLNGGIVQQGVSSCVPSALMRTLEEEELDLEERIQRCQTDARQFLEIKPEMAWSRAQQAVTLLGRPGSQAAVNDEAARQAAYLTLTEVCFTLGIRSTRLPPELGGPDLFEVASLAAGRAGKYRLGTVISAIGKVHRSGTESRMDALLQMVQILPANRAEIEPWLRLEIASKSAGWVDDMESALYNGRNAAVLLQVLPPFLETLEFPDRESRLHRLRQRAATLLVKDKQFAAALLALENLPERQYKLEAVCHEGLGDFRRAAEAHLAAGNSKEALNAFRSVPDVDSALKLALEIGHPSADSLQWISKLRGVVAERPDKFTKSVTPAEKKALEQLLEEALGVVRRKPAPRKAAAKKKAAPKTSPSVKPDTTRMDIARMAPRPRRRPLF